MTTIPKKYTASFFVSIKLNTITAKALKLYFDGRVDSLENLGLPQEIATLTLDKVPSLQYIDSTINVTSMNPLDNDNIANYSMVFIKTRIPLTAPFAIDEYFDGTDIDVKGYLDSSKFSLLLMDWLSISISDEQEEGVVGYLEEPEGVRILFVVRSENGDPLFLLGNYV